MERKRLSQSRLKRLLGKYYNPEEFFSPYSKTTDSQKFGLATEVFMFHPDSFDSEFIELKAEKPTGLMLAFAQYLIDNDIQEFSDTQLEKAYEHSGYTIDFSRVKERFFDNEVDKYVEESIDAKDRLTMTTKQVKDAMELAMHTISCPKVGEVLELRKMDRRYYQKKIKFTYQDEPFVIILDYLKIDSKKREITPFDFKVIDSIDPERHARKWRWDIQGALYNVGIKAWLKEKKLPYRVNPFTFIIARKPVPTAPLVLHLSPEDEYVGLHGKDNIEGLDHLIEKYKHHTKAEDWSASSVNTDKLEIWN